MKFSNMNSAVLPEIALMLKALSDPARLKIMAAVHDQELSVSEIVESTGLLQANTSKHLQILSRAGLLKSRRDKTTIFYQFSDPCILKICDAVCSSYEKILRSKAKWLKD